MFGIENYILKKDSYENQIVCEGLPEITRMLHDSPNEFYYFLLSNNENKHLKPILNDAVLI